MKSSFQHNSIWQAVRFGRQAVKHFLCTSIAPYVNMHLPLHFCQTAFHGHRRYFPNTDGMMLRWCSDSRNKSIKSAHFCPVSIQGSILKSNLIVQTFHFFVMLPTSRIFQFNSKKKKKKGTWSGLGKYRALVSNFVLVSRKTAGDVSRSPGRWLNCRASLCFHLPIWKSGHVYVIWQEL